MTGEGSAFDAGGFQWKVGDLLGPGWQYDLDRGGAVREEGTADSGAEDLGADPVAPAGDDPYLFGGALIGGRVPGDVVVQGGEPPNSSPFWSRRTSWSARNAPFASVRTQRHPDRSLFGDFQPQPIRHREPPRVSIAT